jgi:hypothetical protein
MSFAKFVREINDQLWAPDAIETPAPYLLAQEPIVADEFETPDGRSWVRVYIDGSALDQLGNVHDRAPLAAQARRGDARLALAA